jgi:hypothetical protein
LREGRRRKEIKFEGKILSLDSFVSCSHAIEINWIFLQVVIKIKTKEEKCLRVRTKKCGKFLKLNFFVVF